MRLFGILLIVANLIAGGAFVYFATQDYKGRQEISAAVVRHLLVLQGLPLEGPDLSADPEAENPFVVEQGGGQATATISRELLKSYFKTAMGAPPTRPAGAPLSVLAKDADAREGGVPTMVASQLAEVKRVQALIEAELSGKGPEDRITLLRGWLFFQAETYDLRVAYQELIAPVTDEGRRKTAEQRADELKAHLDARFKAVLEPSLKPDAPANAGPDSPELKAEIDAARAEVAKQRKRLEALRNEEAPLATQVADATAKGMPDEALRKQLDAKRREINGDPNGATDAEKKGQQGLVLEAQRKLAEASAKGRAAVAQSGATRAAATGAEGERRARLAHLLVHLDTDAGWQRRVSVVVGMRRYVRAISDQVLCFRDMIAAVDLGIPGDQVAYVRHEEQLREQATQSVERREAISRQRVALESQMNKDLVARNAQQTQLDRLKAQLRAVKAKVDQDLVEQAAIEKGLYDVQREVGLTLEEVYRLEEVLAAVERERLGLPPR